MSTSEVHDLIVRTRPEGIQETTEQLRQEDEAFEGVSDSMSETAGEMGAVASRLKGVAGVVTAGLGVAAAGLLSQVPVMGEAASGFGAVLESLTLKIDEDLRPGVSSLTDDLFDLSDSIAEADGAAEGFGIAIGGIAAIITEQALDATDDITIEQSVDFLITVGAVAVEEGFSDDVEDKAEEELTIGRAFSLSDLGISISTGMIFADIGNEIARQFVERFNLRERLAIELLEVRKGLNSFTADVQVFAAEIAEFFRRGWESVANTAAINLNKILANLEQWANDILSGIDEGLLDLLGISDTTVNLGRLETRSREEIRRASQRRLGRRRAIIRQRESGRNDRLEAQITDLLIAMANQNVETTVALDGREVARNQEPFLGGKTSDQGRINPLG